MTIASTVLSTLFGVDDKKYSSAGITHDLIVLHTYNYAKFKVL